MKHFLGSVAAIVVATTTICGQLGAGESATVPIPYSTVAEAEGLGIVHATLACGTSRYPHGVLGDAIEAGCLVTREHSGAKVTLTLPEQFVFEDNFPRIADMDGDGRNDVVVVRSDSQAGAALVVYSIVGGELVEIAATPPIGTAFRWLAPVGISDFNNDGRLDVAYVQTPHIGGTLKVWSILENGFTQIAWMRGFSNHSIGQTRVSTSRIVDQNNDGVVDMALPDMGGASIVWVTLHPELDVLAKRDWDESYFDE